MSPAGEHAQLEKWGREIELLSQAVTKAMDILPGRARDAGIAAGVAAEAAKKAGDSATLARTHLDEAERAKTRLQETILDCEDAVHKIGAARKHVENLKPEQLTVALEEAVRRCTDIEPEVAKLTKDLRKRLAQWEKRIDDDGARQLDAMPGLLQAAQARIIGHLDAEGARLAPELERQAREQAKGMTDGLAELIAQLRASMEADLARRTEREGNGLGERSASLQEALARRAKDLESRLATDLDAWLGATSVRLDERTEEVAASLARRAEALAGAQELAGKAGERRIGERVDEELRSLSAAADGLKEDLSARLRQIGEAEIGALSSKLGDVILAMTGDLEAGQPERLARLGEQARRLEQELAGSGQEHRQALTQHTESYRKELARLLEQEQQALEQCGHLRQQSSEQAEALKRCRNEAEAAYRKLKEYVDAYDDLRLKIEGFLLEGMKRELDRRDQRLARLQDDLIDLRGRLARAGTSQTWAMRVACAAGAVAVGAMLLHVVG